MAEEGESLLESVGGEVELVFVLEEGAESEVDQLAVVEVGGEVGTGGVGGEVGALLVDQFEQHGQVAHLVGLHQVLFFLVL